MKFAELYGTENGANFILRHPSSSGVPWFGDYVMTQFSIHNNMLHFNAYALETNRKFLVFEQVSHETNTH